MKLALSRIYTAHVSSVKNVVGIKFKDIYSFIVCHSKITSKKVI